MNEAIILLLALGRIPLRNALYIVIAGCHRNNIKVEC